MTREELRRGLAQLELNGSAVVVHAAPQRLGVVDPGATSLLCEVLLEAIGNGTLLVPAFTLGTVVPRSGQGDDSETAPPRAFHLELPTDDPLGEVLRHFPGALRSAHPTHSFVAVGPLGRELLSTHRDNNPLGPLKKLNLHRGAVVLLGTDLSAAVALHLALEDRLPRELKRRIALRVNAGGHVERVVVEHFPACSRGFDKLEPFLASDQVHSVVLTNATLRKIPIRYLLQLAHATLAQDPTALFCARADCSPCNAARRSPGLAA